MFDSPHKHVRSAYVRDLIWKDLSFVVLENENCRDFARRCWMVCTAEKEDKKDSVGKFSHVRTPQHQS